jgi:hypothetical protein
VGDSNGVVGDGTLRDPLADVPDSTVHIDPDGVVRLRWRAGVHISGPAARAAAAAVNALCAGSRHPMLVDMTATASVTREARTVFTEPPDASLIALLGTSPVDRVVANFILGVSKMPTPTKFFTKESKAMAWLRNGDRDRAA